MELQSEAEKLRSKEHNGNYGKTLINNRGGGFSTSTVPFCTLSLSLTDSLVPAVHKRILRERVFGVHFLPLSPTLARTPGHIRKGTLNFPEELMKQVSTLLLFAALAAFACLPLQGQTATGCFAHLPQYIDNQFEVNYSNGCTGHDEPELDPASGAPGSARDLTWTVVLPTDGTSSVSDVGPTFWFGGTVSDPKSRIRPSIRRASVLSRLTGCKVLHQWSVLSQPRAQYLHGLFSRLENRSHR